MKKIYFSALKTMLALFIVLTSVSSFGQNAKMWRQFNKVDVIPNEPTLTEKGGWVEVSFQVVIPSGYFSKNAAMFIQPELRYKGDQLNLKPLTLKGEEVSGDGVTVNHKDGGTFTYTDNIKYDAKYNRSELFIVSTVYVGKEGTLTTIEEIKNSPRAYECCHRFVSQGVIYTSERFLKKPKYVDAMHGYEPQPVIHAKSTKFYFAVNKYDINWNLKLNNDFKSQEKYNELINFFKEGWKANTVTIDGWASPEGVSVNYALSKNRADVIYNKVIKDLNNLKEEGEGTFSFDNPSEDIQFFFNYRASDFDGFLKDLKASNVKDKDALYESISTADSDAAKDRLLRSAMRKDPAVRKILEPLRRTELAINFVEPYKNDQEVIALAASDPNQLELRELLFAADHSDDAQKMNIYKFIFDKYPKCWISKNNAAVMYMNEGEYDKAEKLFNEAHEMYPDQGVINANIGSLALNKGDHIKAEEFYNKAKEQGVEVDPYNLGVLEIAKGDYKKAAELLSEYSCDYNLGLAQLLAEDYVYAEATLKCTEEAPCQAAYLIAVIGARTDNAGKVIEYLKKAFEIHPGLKKQAKYDREFKKYFNWSEFKAIVN